MSHGADSHRDAADGHNDAAAVDAAVATPVKRSTRPSGWDDREGHKKRKLRLAAGLSPTGAAGFAPPPSHAHSARGGAPMAGPTSATLESGPLAGLAGTPEELSRLAAMRLAASLGLAQQTHADGIDPRTLSVMSRLYVGNLSFDLDAAQIRTVFSQFGTVRSVSMSTDAATGRHKGFCFVEFETPEAAVIAVAEMNGFDLSGRTLKTGRPNSYNEIDVEKLPKAPAERVYVANVSEFINEENLKTVFESFGPLKGCVLLPDHATGKHKGSGYVEFESGEAAQIALATMHNFVLGGLPLKITKACVPGPLPEGSSNLKPPGEAEDGTGAPAFKAAAVPAAVLATAESINARVMSTRAAAGAGAAPHPTDFVTAAGSIPQVGRGHGTAQLDGDIPMVNARSRYDLMQKLMHTESRGPGAADAVPGPAAAAASPAESQALRESSQLVLRNMVSSLDEVDDELREEMEEEFARYGRVEKLDIKQDAREVIVVVLYRTAAEASRAIGVFNGRFFGGRRIAAEKMLTT
ncbi:hypothetical protein CXG81DRAFT_23223 [Caulochytrium protostelioides]|uniref:RRM domain-containing protein n=1 Tax=Caulochytrium protostelioides TaxID=1555241 RepID=A0A4P9WYT8_9FUNG|nr:hypothetical protein CAUPRSCDRAFT_10610 [Caulochytrium protostelioides]RKP04114.1 hypothetical protein CXG81DRAFT_23223 [Caulochytrium protostelioides]|eukprot:RKP04114.1 hypothetical protein CXG81DRAFT_23223 [Caulochytrium protostelioides]